MFGSRRLFSALVLLSCSSDVLAPAGATEPMTEVGALVVLGDAISSRNDPRHYHRILHGLLEERLGEPVVYVNRAFGSSRASDLPLQIEHLPASLPGPVVVVVTSGGNDMQAALPAIAGGDDADERARLRSDLDVALGQLLAPDRFGADVEVRVYGANIFDPSDGAGDYAEFGCPDAGGMPALPTDGAFAAWNGEIAAALGGRGQVLLDAHGLFRGHGYGSDDSWYDRGCAEPNEAGHAALAELFAAAIVGPG